jgi:hypothetical protein
MKWDHIRYLHIITVEIVQPTMAVCFMLESRTAWIDCGAEYGKRFA